MKVICANCGQEMETEHRTMSPGSNDPCWIVEPCCSVPETEEALDNLRDTGLPDLLTALLETPAVSEDAEKHLVELAKNIKEMISSLEFLN